MAGEKAAARRFAPVGYLATVLRLVAVSAAPESPRESFRFVGELASSFAPRLPLVEHQNTRIFTPVVFIPGVSLPSSVPAASYVARRGAANDGVYGVFYAKQPRLSLTL